MGYNKMINLDYPGLRLVYVSPVMGCPIFEVDGFLTVEECEKLRAKIQKVGLENMTKSSAGKCEATSYGSGLNQTGERTSSSFQIPRHESTGVHEKLAKLTKRNLNTFHHLKLIRYEEGGEFGLHSDASGMMLDELCTNKPSYGNVEISIFIYLNTVERGGGTSFNPSCKDEQIRKYKEEDYSSEVFRVKPEQGKAVMHFVTAQENIPKGTIDKVSRKLKLANIPGIGHIHEVGSHGIYMNEHMFHSGLPACDPKEIVAIWSWAHDIDRSQLDNMKHIWSEGNEIKETDGVVV